MWSWSFAASRTRFTDELDPELGMMQAEGEMELSRPLRVRNGEILHIHNKQPKVTFLNDSTKERKKRVVNVQMHDTVI